MDRIIGFEGLGRGDSFTVRELETRLLRSGVLVRAKANKEDETMVRRSGQTTAKSNADEDNDDDWD